MVRKIRAVVFLEEELEFLKRLRESGKLINLVMKEVFSGLPTEGEKVVAAMQLLDGRISLKVELAEARSETRDPRFRDTDGPERPARSKRRDGKRNLLSELAEAAKDFEE